MKRIGIVSLFYHNWNFGGMLQAYALNRAIRELGYEAETMCQSIRPAAHSGATIKERFKLVLYNSNVWTLKILDIYHRILDIRDLRAFCLFEQKEVPHGPYCGTREKLAAASKKFDGLITGSDQVWNPSFFRDEILYLHGLTFARKELRKVAYAASMGAESAAIGKEELFREILDGLDFISVREKSAKEFLQPLTDKPVTVVLDPTMLLARQEWDELAVGPGWEPAHLFAYFLAEPDNRHDRQLHQIADVLGLPVRCIADEAGVYPRPGSGDVQRWDAGPKEFVGEIRDAELVLTNSFHGIVFSVLFHKPFWVFKRNRDDDRGSMNNRVTDFLADFGLEDRLLEDGEFPSQEKLARPIDYEAVDRILAEKREFSLNWLRKALEGI